MRRYRLIKITDTTQRLRNKQKSENITEFDTEIMWEENIIIGGKISSEVVKTTIYDTEYQISDMKDKCWKFSQSLER